MRFFRKRKNEETNMLKVDEVNVATATIISSYNDRCGAGPKAIKWMFLVREKRGQYYEIFSDKKIESEEDTHKDEFVCQNFDTPYIVKVEPLSKYLKNPKTKVMGSQQLFDFITYMLVLEQVKGSNRKQEN